MHNLMLIMSTRRRSGRYICFSRKGRLRTWVSAELLIPDENTLKCVLCLVLLNLLPMCNSVVFNLGNKDGCLSDAAFSEVFVNQLSALPCRTTALPTVLIQPVRAAFSSFWIDLGSNDCSLKCF